MLLSVDNDMERRRWTKEVAFVSKSQAVERAAASVSMMMRMPKGDGRYVMDWTVEASPDT
jgi:hypothetical protein